MDVLFGEQNHIFRTQTGNNNHGKVAVVTWQPHWGESEAGRIVFHPMGSFVNLGHLDFEGLVEVCGQVAQEDGSVVADDNVADAKLLDDSANTDTCEDFVEVIALEALHKEPDRMETVTGKHQALSSRCVQ